MIGKDTSGFYDIYLMYLLWDFLTNFKSKLAYSSSNTLLSSIFPRLIYLPGSRVGSLSGLSFLFLFLFFFSMEMNITH